MLLKPRASPGTISSPSQTTTTHALLAQLAEQLTLNQRVVGSSPTGGISASNRQDTSKRVNPKGLRQAESPQRSSQGATESDTTRPSRYPWRYPPLPDDPRPGRHCGRLARVARGDPRRHPGNGQGRLGEGLMVDYETATGFFQSLHVERLTTTSPRPCPLFAHRHLSDRPRPSRRRGRMARVARGDQGRHRGNGRSDSSTE